MARRARGAEVTFDDVRRLALALPEAFERTSYGRPSFYVGKKMLCCLGKQSDHIVVRIGIDEREMLMEAAPETYFVTDHYRGWPYVLVRLATVRKDALAGLLQRTWREIAPARLVKAAGPL
jgi:hypothetical protein